MPLALSRRHSRGVFLEALEGRTLFAFGVTTTATSYIVDNGANLQFTILRAGTVSSTIHLGDMTSVKYKGAEMLATYAVTSRYSHYEQGLGSGAVVSATVDPNGQWILIAADDSASAASAIQYYAVRKGDDTIYMASLPTDVTAGPGEGRYIAYLDRNVFTSPEAPSDNLGNTGAIEGSDVFGHADGTTTSKFYNMGRRMIENQYHGLVGTAGGSSVGAWMYMGNREHSAGGPFFKDIDFQSGSAVEIYNCLFTGHTQTESYRQGLYTYGMSFNDGSTPPAALDYSWMSALNLSGWIPDSQRGTLTGTASGGAAGHEMVVALSNSTEQYWAFANPTTGLYAINGIHAGTYTETLYDNELAVGTRSVTIAGGQTTAADITNTAYQPAATWRIGTWDGTPLGFLNADKIEIMHPSDVRMASWTSTPNFVVGTNTDSQWAMTQFMGVNNSQRITFTLTSAQAAQAQTLRIGITLGFEGGRNRITVNAGQSYAWTSAIPAASKDLNSRGITRGTWRGVNQLYTYNIPTTALKAGVNTIDLPVVSGSYVAGQTWLSPNVTYDAIDLVPTSSITNAPVVSSIAISPTGDIAQNMAKKFSAIAKDQFGAVTPANLVWTATRGTIDDTGAYRAPATTGSDTVTATYNGITATYTFNVFDPAPTIATAAAAAPKPVTGKTVSLSVLGDDNNGESALTYAWSATGPAAVSYSANGTNAAKNTTATFMQAGTYTFTATITDGSGGKTTSSVSVTVNQSLTSIAVTPSATTIKPGATQQFTAIAKDQFGASFTSSPTFTWSVTGGGTISTGGLYTAPGSATTATVKATAGSVSSTATVSVVPSYVLPRNWWKMDQSSGTSVTDSAGTATGTTVNGPTWKAGKFGNALSFDGTNDYVNLPNNLANTTAGSISMWVNTSKNYTDLGMLFYTAAQTGGNGGGSQKEMHLNFTSGGKLQFFIEGGSKDVNIISAKSYNDGLWHNVVATWDINGNATLYVDGIAVGTQVHDAYSFVGASRTRLGRPDTNSRYYQGLMDDVRLYNVAISAAQVQALYTGSGAGGM